MSEWQLLIPRCFGAENLVFAGAPEELTSAWALRAQVSKANIPSPLLERAIEDWLHTQTSNTGQLYEQMERVRSFFGR